MATYDITTTTPSSIKTGDILNCPYSGTYKTLTLPKGQYKLEVWGAQGGYRSSTTYGGKGGYSVGTINLTTRTTVYLYAGGAGNTGGTAGGWWRRWLRGLQTVQRGAGRHGHRKAVEGVGARSAGAPQGA